MSDSPRSTEIRTKSATHCVHCGLKIDRETYGTHLEGSQSGKQRCGSESGLEYGYNAHAPGTPCANPCLGGVRADPRHPQEAELGRQADERAAQQRAKRLGARSEVVKGLHR